MPKNRPGRMKRVTASKAINHGAPAVEQNYVGLAVKTSVRRWFEGLTIGGDGQAAPAVIANGESFNMIVKGEVEVDQLAGAAKGDPVYIVAATGVLTETAAGNVPFGRVADTGGQRGLPAGRMRVDLDDKDFA